MKELLDYLATTPKYGRFRSWQIERIGGSANNILYRASNEEADLAVKFTIRDARRRAWREYSAFRASHDVGLDVLPEPILLDEESYTQPVVVAKWMEGEVTAVPPQTDSEWIQLIELYVKLRQVTPQNTTTTIPKGLINFASVAEAMQQIQLQCDMMPNDAYPEQLRALLAQLETFPDGPPASASPISLCHVDANTLNFLRRSQGWASVDWENAGWGDPAFEIVDTMTHPQYMDVPEERWTWFVEKYGELSGDETAVARIKRTYPLMLVWWVARLSRALYEIPRGKDERLVKRPSNWQDDLLMKLAWYAERAEKSLASGFAKRVYPSGTISSPSSGLK